MSTGSELQEQHGLQMRIIHLDELHEFGIAHPEHADRREAEAQRHEPHGRGEARNVSTTVTVEV